MHEGLVETFSLKLEKQANQQLKQRASLEKSHAKTMKKVSKSQQQAKMDEAETKHQAELQDLINLQHEKVRVKNGSIRYLCCEKLPL